MGEICSNFDPQHWTAQQDDLIIRTENATGPEFLCAFCRVGSVVQVIWSLHFPLGKMLSEQVPSTLLV